MLDEADLRRLAENGVDVYVPRNADASQVGGAASTAMGPAASAGAVAAVLLADVSAPRAAALVAAVKRALAFARVSCTHADVPDERALSDVQALVAFGDARARAAGALLSAQRQREIAWVVTREPAALATDAQGKRALWSELKRIAGQRTNGR